MRLAVVGSGPAGLTAAFRLQQIGHDVTVFEACDVVGGRTHSEHFGPGHWADTGAGWLASFYPRTLAVLDELRLTDLLRPMPLRGGGELMIDGRVVPFPSSLRRILSSPLLGPADKARFLATMARLFAHQRGNLTIDAAYDDVEALDDLAGMGETARDRIVRPLFEGPFFSRLEEMSAALVRSWLRVLSVGRFFQVAGGMDAPWRRLGDVVGVRTSSSVERITPRAGFVEIAVAGASERYDGCVVAVPAPVAAQLVDGAPPCLGDLGTRRTCGCMPRGEQPDHGEAAFTCSRTTPSPLSRSEAAVGARGAACPTTGAGRSCAPPRRPVRRCWHVPPMR